MQILDFDDPRRPWRRGACLIHPYTFGRRLAALCYAIPGHPGPTITQAAEAVATSYVRLIPGRDPNEVLWLQAWPPAALPGRGQDEFPVLEVNYIWRRGEAHGPMWWIVEPALADTVRRLWYRHEGPVLARTLADSASA